MSYFLSRLARADLADIRDYTEQKWGETQWLQYYAGLVKTFENIAERPHLGQDRSLLLEGMRSVVFKRHIVFFKCYPQTKGAPVILRIAHEKRLLSVLQYYDDLDGI